MPILPPGSGPGITQTGGYPTLETIANLVRVLLNDWQAGATGTPGEGQITTDNPALSPQTLVALNSSIREVYRELRNTGAAVLIRDNVQVSMPANAVTGTGIQTYLTYNGWFDGANLQPGPLLPPDLLYPLELWEQQTGQSLPFIRMHQPEFGLSSRNQTFALGEWDWHGGAQTGVAPGSGGSDAIWFIGSLSPVTIRIRYLAALTQFVTPTQYSNCYVPIQDCEEAVAYKTAAKIAGAIGGAVDAQSLAAQAVEQMRQLKLAYVRRQQTVEYHRKAYGGDHPRYGSWGVVIQ